MQTFARTAAAFGLAVVAATLALPAQAIDDDSRIGRGGIDQIWRGIENDWRQDNRRLGNWRRGGAGRRGSAITVSGGTNPPLNAAIERELSALVGRQAGRINIFLTRVDIDPRVRARRSERLRQPLGRGGFGFDRRCGPQTLVYDVRRGTVRARYSLRYTVQGPRIAPQRERAKGRVSAPFEEIGSAVIRSRCGTQRLGGRQLEQLTGLSPRQARRPLAAVRGPLAYEIARDIAQDLRGVRWREGSRRQRY